MPWNIVIGSEHTKTERHDERERGGEREGGRGRREGERGREREIHKSAHPACTEVSARSSTSSLTL